MSIIIDANRCGDFESSREVAKLVARAISDKKIKLTVCKALLRELAKTRFRRLILTWDQIGMLIRLDDNLYELSLEFIQSIEITSDDPHILALAHASGCRLLYTEDGELTSDFKDTRILRPKGKVMRPDTNIKIVRSLLQRHAD